MGLSPVFRGAERVGDRERQRGEQRHQSARVSSREPGSKVSKAPRGLMMRAGGRQSSSKGRGQDRKRRRETRLRPAGCGLGAARGWSLCPAGGSGRRKAELGWVLHSGCLRVPGPAPVMDDPTHGRPASPEAEVSE
jgi:hypothetical protein